MITILSQAQPAQAAAAPSPEPVESPFFDDKISLSETTEGDFEWVVGPGQMAALGFLAIAAIALFSGVSYLAGKAAVTQPDSPPPALQVKLAPPVAPPPAPSISEQFEISAVAAPHKAPDAPMFADPAAGKNYIQMAAVEKPVAAIFAEGLRSHGLTAFVAPGATPNIYRVLIGPVSDIQAYTATKVELDKIGLSTFMRQYEK
jgi:cell division septation protein DedD